MSNKEKVSFSACTVCGKDKKRPNPNPRCSICANREKWNDSFRKKMSERMSRENKKRWESENYKEKVSQSMRKIYQKQEIKEMCSNNAKHSWSQNEDRRDALKERNRDFWKDQEKRDIARKNISIAQGGSGNIDQIEEKERYKLASWTRSVKNRDKHTCTNCGSKEELHAHHVLPKALYPDLRFCVENGMALCKKCHYDEHKKMKTRKILADTDDEPTAEAKAIEILTAHGHTAAVKLLRERGVLVE